MKLFYSPGACSLGIHVILEEIGAPFELVLSSARDGSLYTPEFMAMNPKSKVPTLMRDDGSVVTEYPAISMWLGRTHPAAKLIPDDVDLEIRMLEAIDYIVATVHMQGFTRIARPARFTEREDDHDAVKATGRGIYLQGMQLLDKQLEGRDWLIGPYSLADAALLYVEAWAPRAEIELPANCAAHLKRMKQRPAVQRAFRAEGLVL